MGRALFGQGAVLPEIRGRAYGRSYTGGGGLYRIGSSWGGRSDEIDQREPVARSAVDALPMGVDVQRRAAR
uniref:hypothetical protein n=1 Tax=Novilysobacter viscosus TaxID=3098602 RepID=UPI002EDB974E